MSRRNSPISSRNSVPPSASWNLPRCLSLAPVNEPFSWPNRMDSIRFSGIAPQLTVTKGLPARSDEPWMARAISSLPTPDSPSIRIGMLDCAARWPSRNTCFISADLATRSSKTRRLSVFFFSRVTSPDSVPILSWLRMETAMRSGLAGLTRKSLAPARIASTAESMPPLAVSTITGRSGLAGAQFGQHLKPAHVGHDEVEQHERDLIAARAVDEVERGSGRRARSPRACPSGVIAASSSRRCTGSSSTIRMVCAIGPSLGKTPWWPATGKGLFKSCPSVAQFARASRW